MNTRVIKYHAALCLSVFVSIAVLNASPVRAQGEKPLDVIFESADTDHNGLVSEQEWHAYMQQRFEKLDLNHDGNLSREEAEQARGQARESLRERLQNRRSAVTQ